MASGPSLPQGWHWDLDTSTGRWRFTHLATGHTQPDFPRGGDEMAMKSTAMQQTVIQTSQAVQQQVTYQTSTQKEAPDILSLTTTMASVSLDQQSPPPAYSEPTAVPVKQIKRKAVGKVGEWKSPISSDARSPVEVPLPLSTASPSVDTSRLPAIHETAAPSTLHDIASMPKNAAILRDAASIESIASSQQMYTVDFAPDGTLRLIPVFPTRDTSPTSASSSLSGSRPLYDARHASVPMHPYSEQPNEDQARHPSMPELQHTQSAPSVVFGESCPEWETPPPLPPRPDLRSVASAPDTTVLDDHLPNTLTKPRRRSLTSKAGKAGKAAGKAAGKVGTWVNNNPKLVKTGVVMGAVAVEIAGLCESVPVAGDIITVMKTARAVSKGTQRYKVIKAKKLAQQTTAEPAVSTDRAIPAPGLVSDSAQLANGVVSAAAAPHHGVDPLQALKVVDGVSHVASTVGHLASLEQSYQQMANPQQSFQQPGGQQQPGWNSQMQTLLQQLLAGAQQQPGPQSYAQMSPSQPSPGQNNPSQQQQQQQQYYSPTYQQQQPTYQDSSGTMGGSNIIYPSVQPPSIDPSTIVAPQPSSPQQAFGTGNGYSTYIPNPTAFPVGSGFPDPTASSLYQQGQLDDVTDLDATTAIGNSQAFVQDELAQTDGLDEETASVAADDASDFDFSGAV